MSLKNLNLKALLNKDKLDVKFVAISEQLNDSKRVRGLFWKKSSFGESHLKFEPKTDYYLLKITTNMMFLLLPSLLQSLVARDPLQNKASNNKTQENDGDQNVVKIVFQHIESAARRQTRIK